MRNYLFITMLSLVVSGCFREEDTVPRYPRGEAAEARISIGVQYENQVYFDVEHNEVVRINSKMLWDIAFSCSGDSAIRLNSGRNMRAAFAPVQNLSDVRDTNGLDFRWDWSNGKTDSTALYGWNIREQVVVIHLGLDENNKSMGYVKAKFRMGNDTLYISHSMLDQSTVYEDFVVADPKFNHVHYSFVKQERIQAEPEKHTYDLYFTQYIYYFEQEKLAYLVVGALLNPWNTSAYLSDKQNFNEVGINDLDPLRLSTARDVIGYDWKYFSFGEGTYVVLDRKNYFLKDAEGFYYKLHFIGFYDENGNKGFPVIAHEKI